MIQLCVLQSSSPQIRKNFVVVVVVFVIVLLPKGANFIGVK
jgi:hypothetical protein